MLAIGTALPVLDEVPMTGYAVADLSGAGIGLAYSAPLLAAMSSYATRGWADVHKPLRSRRRGSTVVAAGFWPLLVGGPVVGCLAICISARTVPDTRVAWLLLLTFFAVLCAAALLGVGLSWALPVVIAVPTAAVFGFMWINYLPASSSRELHQLTPMIDGFATTSQPSRTAVASIFVLSGALVLGVLLALALTRWEGVPRFLAAAAVVMTVALACAAGWVVVTRSSQPLNLLAAEPRSTSLACAMEDGIEVCVWPEDAGRRGELGRSAARLNEQLRAWKQPLISTLTVRPEKPNGVSVDASRGLGHVEMTLSMAHGYVDQRADCPVPLSRDTEELVLALAIATSPDDSGLADYVDAKGLQAARSRLAQPTSGVAAWFQAAVSDLQCSPAP